MSDAEATTMPSMGTSGMNNTPASTPIASDTAWPEACRGIHVIDPWAKPNIPGAPNSAAYALVLNLSAANETLVGVDTAVAQAELHTMTMGENDVMVMRPVEGGIVIPAGGTAQLQPGGLHVMLMNLKSELPVGGSFDLTLRFATSGPISLTVPIREPADDSGTAGT